MLKVSVCSLGRWIEFKFIRLQWRSYIYNGIAEQTRVFLGQNNDRQPVYVLWRCSPYRSARVSAAFWPRSFRVSGSAPAAKIHQSTTCSLLSMNTCLRMAY